MPKTPPQENPPHSNRYGFTKLDQAWFEQHATDIVLTPNERLAREVQRAYNQWRLERGDSTWQPLDCLSLNRFFLRQYADTRDFAAEHLCEREIISQDLLWQVAHSCAPDHPGADISAFCEAYEQVLAYDLNLSDPEFAAPQRVEFRTWFQSVHDTIAAAYIHPAQIPQVMLNQMLQEAHSTPLAQAFAQPNFVLLNIDQLTNPQYRYFKRILNADNATAYTSPGVRDLQLQRGTFTTQAQPMAGTGTLLPAQSLTEELTCAAKWAKDVLAALPGARVGIVVPELARYYALTARIIGSTLNPELGSLTPDFDIGSGTPMAELPLWQDAILMLDYEYSQLSYSQACTLAQSPYFHLPKLHHFAHNWPADAGTRVSATSLSDRTQSDDGAVDFSGWCNRFLKLLSLREWGKDQALGSAQFQALQQLNDTLVSLSNNTRHVAGARIPYAVARQNLNTLLQRKTFAIERKPSRLQVLGALETTGLSFSHLWICGMDERTLPAQVKHNRYIPARLATRAGVPRTTPSQELQLARELISQWQTAAVLNISYSTVVDGGDQLPSPLTSEITRELYAANTESFAVDESLTDPNNPFLETYQDSNAPNIEDKRVNGGTRIFEDQAACPFKAFAIHRLGLSRDNPPADFPNALARGIYLHGAMQDLLQKYPRSEDLLNLDRSVIESACFQQLSKTGQYPQSFLTNETQRLTELVLEWLVVEAQRGPFTAVEIERSYVLDLEHVQIEVRVDRIDRVDNMLLLIDYKTGSISISDPSEVVTRQAQLPLYSIIDEQIQGVFYAQVVKDNMAFKGLATPDSPIKSSKKLAVTWSELVDTWRTELTHIAYQYATGHAQVIPQKGACTYCHLFSVCRASERV